MPTPFAFFPVCFLFTSLALLIVLVLVLGIGATQSAFQEETPTVDDRPRPPYWVAPVVLAGVLLFLFLLTYVTAG